MSAQERCLSHRADSAHVQEVSWAHTADWVCAHEQTWAHREDSKTKAQCFGVQPWGLNWKQFRGPVWT